MKNPRVVSAADLLASAFHAYKAQDIAACERMLTSILASSPRHFDALQLMGVIKLQQGQYELAHKAFMACIQVNPHSAAAFANMGIVLKAIKRYDDAIKAFDGAIARNPKLGEAYLNKSACLIELRKFKESLQCSDSAVALLSSRPEAWVNKAIAHRELMEAEEAEEILRRLTKEFPLYPNAWRQLGNLLFSQGRFDDALLAIDRAIDLCRDAASLMDKGFILMKLRRIIESTQCFNESIALDPLQHMAYIGLSDIECIAGNHAAALKLCDKALAISPKDGVVWARRGSVNVELGNKADALNDLDLALMYGDDLLQARMVRARLLINGKKISDAESDIKILNGQSVGVSPVDVLAVRVSAQLNGCSWAGIDGLVRDIAECIRNRSYPITPFTLIPVIEDPELLLCAGITMCAAIRAALPSGTDSTSALTVAADGRIRVAYMSPDFHNHPIMIILGDVFGQHDRSKFSWYGVSLGRNLSGPQHEKARRSFDEFIDAADWSDKELLDWFRSNGIHIVVDLAGHTEGQRLSVLEQRCAPVQVNYIGYPGTSGAAHIDYILGSEIIVPEGSEVYYSEKVVKLPWLVPIAERDLGQVTLTRVDAGIPDGVFVFCCFNNSNKFTPAIFDAWCRILHAVQHSVLWLVASNEEARDNLLLEAERRGLARERMIVSIRAGYDIYIARMKLADLFLDTYPFNAHTTALDALWASLPVLTCAGRAFSSRMAAGVLDSLGLQDFICNSLAEYEHAAIRLGSVAKDRVEEVKRYLGSETLRDGDVFNSAHFARMLESAYCDMYARSVSKLPPVSFSVG